MIRNLVNKTSLLNMSISLKVLMYVFMISLVFDPSDKVLGIKLPIFILLAIKIIYDLMHVKTFNFNPKAMKIFFIFSGIGIISFIIGATLKIDFNVAFGLAKVKSLLFVAALVMLSMYKYDYLKMFVNVLLVMSIAIIFLAIIALIDIQPLVSDLYDFGNSTVSFTINWRTYGGVRMPSMYFHSSPFLVIAVAYYCDRMCKVLKIKMNKKSKEKSVLLRQKIVSLILFLICALGMFLTGSRNNMLFSVLVVAVVIFINSEHKAILFAIACIIGVIVFVAFNEIIMGMFDLEESSNSTKIAMLNDYWQLLIDNPVILIVGQGLGGGIFIPERGMMSITELSYLDIFRWWGIFGGIIILILMFYPLYSIIHNKQKELIPLAIAYGAFLIMIAVNPFFFNSVGLFFYALITDATLKRCQIVNKSLRKFNCNKELSNSRYGEKYEN